jgi:hypothetical protein
MYGLAGDRIVERSLRHGQIHPVRQHEGRPHPYC